MRCVICDRWAMTAEPRYLQKRSWKDALPSGNCHFCWGPVVIRSRWAPIPARFLWDDPAQYDPTWVPE